MNGDVIEQMLETTRRTTNIASRLVQSLEFRNAARPSTELAARIELAKQLRDSMLRKLDELEQLVKNYRAAEKRIEAGELVASPLPLDCCPQCSMLLTFGRSSDCSWCLAHPPCPPHEWFPCKIRGAQILEQQCTKCHIVEVIA